MTERNAAAALGVRSMRRVVVLAAMAAAGLGLDASTNVAHGQAHDAGPSTAPATQPATAPSDDFGPGVRVDAQHNVIELDAEVVLTEGWLETLACAPQTKEHESILRIATPPRTVHAALLSLGARPGSPLRVVSLEDGTLDIRPPTGDRVRVELVHEVDGAVVVTPAGAWVRNRVTGEPLADSVWVFAGSAVRRFQGQEVYLGDREGVTISLVNFGADVLARATRQTDANADHDMAWVVNTEAVPPVGTRVVVRLTPLPPRLAPLPAGPDGMAAE
ncbi:MAG: YdjY domain-containing protein [Planctomycetota bacterium]